VARASDFGRNDRTLFARTHLGHLLHAGDTALGYDLAAANVADAGLEAAMERGLVLPDVVLVSPALNARVRVGSANRPGGRNGAAWCCRTWSWCALHWVLGVGVGLGVSTV